jgi:hypothetical protein
MKLLTDVDFDDPGRIPFASVLVVGLLHTSAGYLRGLLVNSLNWRESSLLKAYVEKAQPAGRSHKKERAMVTGHFCFLKAYFTKACWHNCFILSLLFHLSENVSFSLIGFICFICLICLKTSFCLLGERNETIETGVDILKQMKQKRQVEK